MARYVAFLRGINVGGHTVRMEHLRRVFEALGCGEASTFIASGNVLFTSEAVEPAELEQRIEPALREALGYEAATFVRTASEVARIAAYRPFPDLEAHAGDTQYVVFLRHAPDAATRDRVLALATPRDLLHLHGPELYWLRHGSLLDSTITLVELGRALGGMPNTMRNANTLRRLAAKVHTPQPRQGDAT